MKRLLLALSLVALVQADPAHDHATITSRKKMQSFHYPLALYSPQPEEQSQIGGPKDLPVLALYFFRHQRSPEEHKAFAAALAAKTHGTGSEYPYAVLELGLNLPDPLSSKSIQVFNVGRCTNANTCGLTGAMLNDPSQAAQWKIELTTLKGELKDGGTIEYDLNFEHKASRYQAEFLGSAPVMLVETSRYH
ncbi:MAG: hypothetical protein KIS61_30655 [Candidatus Eremiobacteraeota bacterium]|nr:hypothetical protein [Candidatus Eremiobacteraeota bacterium]